MTKGQANQSLSVVRTWFRAWESGKLDELPLAENFTHESPYGKIVGKQAYFQLVDSHRDKFLGYQFEVHELLGEGNRACSRYTARQGSFSLEVSEWYHLREGLLEEVIAYYDLPDKGARDRQIDYPE